METWGLGLDLSNIFISRTKYTKENTFLLIPITLISVNKGHIFKQTPGFERFITFITLRNFTKLKGLQI